MPELALLGFDPYVAWLGIEVERRPLNAYELLRLEPLETRRARIEAAADRQRVSLANHRGEIDDAAFQDLEAELEQAIATLMSSERKAILDASLRRRLVTTKDDSSGNSSGAGRERSVTLTCRRCEKPNLPDRKFCAACGGALWEPCPQCGVVGPSGERFCGACGADITGHLEQRRAQFTEKLDAAAALHADNRFDEAQQLLREVAKVDDSRFNDVATMATERIERYSSERRQREGKAALALENAQRLVETYRWDEAITMLEAVPLRLRTTEMETKLVDAKSRAAEWSSLLAEVRAALAAKKTIELLPKIDRLLALNPQYEQGRKLGRDIAARLEQGAAKLLGEHRYDEATRLLRQVPAYAVREETQKLNEQAAELSSLWREVRTAPLANGVLLGLADRLLKLAPKNAAAAKAREEIALESSAGWRSAKTRTATEPKPSMDASQGGSAAIFAGPLRTGASDVGPIGIPVRSLVGSQRLQIEDATAQREWQNHPGRFFVACGLALQGVQQATLNLNLMPTEKKSLLSGLSLSFRKRKESVAWGIDLSGSSLKAIKLAWDETHRVARVEVCELAEELGVSPELDSNRESPVAENLLREFVARHKLTKADLVVTNLAGLSILGRFVDVPPVEPKKLDSLVEFEARQQIPFNLDELIWDYATTDGLPDDGREARARRVAIVATKEPAARGRIAMFDRQGLHVRILQSDAVALHNYFRFDSGSAAPAALLLDVGSSTTNMIYSAPNDFWFRTIGVGGDLLTTALVREFRLSHEQAEQRKRQPSLAPRYHKFNAVLTPQFEHLEGEIDRSLAALQATSSQRQPKSLIGCGGGFATHGLFGFLTRR